jgi:hypothetical protein
MRALPELRDTLPLPTSAVHSYCSSADTKHNLPLQNINIQFLANIVYLGKNRLTIE